MYKNFKCYLSAVFNNSNLADLLDQSDRVNWLRNMPFFLIHILALGVFFVKMSFTGWGVCLASYVIRMFSITGFYHRYFSHKTFKTNAVVETIFGILGTCALQRGPIWWAAHHRHHHLHSDHEEDEHSPITQSFMKSHMLWFMSNKNFQTQKKYVKDLLRKKHLVLIDDFENLIALAFLVSLYIAGELLHCYTAYSLSGWSTVFWGGILSTVILYHATFSINSLSHLFGKRTYQTTDQSKNNWFLAILTLGEGWHNNHHYAPNSAKSGFEKFQLDITFLIILLMKKCRLIHDIHTISKTKQLEGKICE